METELINRSARLHWGLAMEAGVVAGAVVLLLSHGIPWFTSGLVSPELMGRDLDATGLSGPYRTWVAVAGHFGLSIVYGLAIAALAGRVRGLFGVGLGAIVGLVLYALNFGVFSSLQVAGAMGTEVSALVTHFVFGAVAAGTYKGLASRREAQLMR